jgi:phage baseplate assembly protein W
MANETTLESIQTNLISLLTLKRRHRVMHNNLYSPFWDYIFEPWDDISSTTLRTELIDKIGEYIPQVEVVNILFDFDGEKNLLHTKIVYRISELGGFEDDVSITLPVGQGE